MNQCLITTKHEKKSSYFYSIAFSLTDNDNSIMYHIN